MTQNIIIAFHSYAKKPCVDGLLSAILISKLYSDGMPLFVPYARTNESFTKLRQRITKVGISNLKIVYVDCAPELKEEVDYLLSLLDDVQIQVLDHHPLGESTPLKCLLDHPNFSYQFQGERCAAMMVYEMLNDEARLSLNIDDLMTMVQFSEYQGMNDKLANASETNKVVEIACKKSVNSFPHQKENIQKILETEMTVYYFLDKILPDGKNWQFLYGDEGTSERFEWCATDFLSSRVDLLQGKNAGLFSDESVNAYMKLLEEMDTALNNADIIRKQMVGERHCCVLLAPLSIFTYGRSLEPKLCAKMRQLDVCYAILMNPATANKDGALTHYFSLRRVSELFDARELASYVKAVSGSKIGGGHPWGSGVTLNEHEYDAFMKEMRKVIAEKKVD